MINIYRYGDHKNLLEYDKTHKPEVSPESMVLLPYVIDFTLKAMVSASSSSWKRETRFSIAFDTSLFYNFPMDNKHLF